MDQMASIAVTAGRLAVRAQAGTIFVRFLIHYPMGPKRVEGHLRQAIGNLG